MSKLNLTNFNTEEKREECGIVAILSKKGLDVAPAVYRALLALQHRGQDACGMTIFDGYNLNTKKGFGLVNEVFTEKLNLKGSIGIGHTRYPTVSACEIVDVQPLVYKNIAVSHNGHLANYVMIKKELEQTGFVFDGTVDSEIIAFLLKEQLELGLSLEKVLEHLMQKLDGAYSNACIVAGQLLVFRDPHAIRPLVWGENEDYICFASESVALDINKIPYKGSVNPGELVLINNSGIERKNILKKEIKHCMFEYVYFSRPDSKINDQYVFEIRKNLGKELAKEHLVKADVVIPVPDTSRTAAEIFAKELNIAYEEGIIKNRYIGRTFIMPNQDKRALAVRMKLNPVRGLIENKSVVLIDDSIVRGTTLREIILSVREAGAKEIHVRITSPPITNPCFYGVNIPSFGELIANQKSIEEIRKFLTADSLGYLSIEGLQKAIGLPICTGCLNADYPTEQARINAKNINGK